MNYTDNYNLRKPEPTDPVDIDDLNYNADEIDSLLKGIADGLDGITPEGIGAETPTGAQQKANQAETNAKSYADIVTNSALNSAKDYADDVLESANSHTDQVASDLSQKVDETRIKVLDVEQDVSNISKVLINLNPNQESKQKVSGYGIVSLPKNAANGQVSGIEIKGGTINVKYSVLNFVDSDGDGLPDGYSWISERIGTNPSTENGVFRFYGNNNNISFVTINVNVLDDNYDHIVYIKTLVKSNSNNAHVLYGNNAYSKSNYHSGNENYEVLSLVGDAYNNTRIRFVLDDIGEDKYFEISKIMLVDLTENFGAGNEPSKEWCDEYFDFMSSGTKSTISAMRIRSVSSDETQQSEIYIPNIGELRSLPNGVKDEVNVIVEGKHTKRVSDPVSVSGTMFASLDTTTYVNVDVVKTTAFSDAMAGTTSKDGMTRLYDKNGAELSEVAQTDIDNAASVGKYYWHTDKTLWIIVAKGAYADITAARTGLGTMTLIYQLATPIEIPIQTSGSLVSYPSGTVYIEPFVADAGIYVDKMEVLHSDLPIKALEKISKVDFDTGLETELDITAAVIAEDKLSFTHPDLTSGDIVFFVYEHGAEGTIPETEISYYDSRYVIKDSVTGKFYKWHIAVADGVPSIELVEV